MDSFDRAQLLPKSGVGVVSPWLIIAPPGNPVIRIDLRALDRVEIRPEGNEDDAVDDDSPAVSDPLSHDDPEMECVPDHDRRCDVILACGDLEVALCIADGPEAAARIVADAAPWTRENDDLARSARVSTATDRANRPASYGRLVVISSTSDGEVRQNDAMAGYVYELTEPMMLVGRSGKSNLVINHRSISREHAKVSRDLKTDRYTITDLHASNGVRVNGERCIGVELNDGDILDLGHVRMRFMAPGTTPEGSLRTPPPSNREPFLFVGSDAVVLRGDKFIQVGSLAFGINEVREYAVRGANIPLTGGRLLQAAMALLVLAAAEREPELPR